METKTTRLQEALDRLISRYQGTNVEDILRATAADFQDFENAAAGVRNDCWLDTAAGIQLDLYGAILNVSRGGFSDDDYRIRIKARIIRYQSSGTIEEIIQAVQLLTQARSVQIIERYPAKIDITAMGVGTVLGSASEIATTIKNAKMGGVGVENFIVSKDPPFVFFEDPDPLGEGFGDETDPLLGGYLSEIMFSYMDRKDFGFYGTGSDSQGFSDKNNPSNLIGGFFISE